MSIILSVIIPAYNEAERLPPYLVAIRDHLDGALPGGYEVIVVDDGSRDGMAGRLRRSFGDWPELRIEAHPTNRGKGAAVRSGVLSARGELVLFADADGATPIGEERRLRAAIAAGADIAAGSRLLPAEDSPVTRSAHRGLPGRMFAGLVRLLFDIPIRDTQCGFKMFRHDAARHLFAPCRVDGYVFDVAILAAARRLGHRIVEVPIRWTEMAGSRVDLVSDSCKMLWGLLALRLRGRESDRPSVHPADLRPGI